jgi:feruloyl-CoA synthase
LWLPAPPSLDRGEITDKGSINQRAVIAHHPELIEQLYSPAPRPDIAVIHQE